MWQCAGDTDSTGRLVCALPGHLAGHRPRRERGSGSHGVTGGRHEENSNERAQADKKKEPQDS
jgi:hypothetical protein